MNIILLVLLTGLVSSSEVTSYKVIRFKDKSHHENVKEGEDVKETHTTRKLTSCFRLMPRYHRDYYVIHTHQLSIVFRGAKNGFISFSNPKKSSTSSLRFFRFFSMCQPRVPGIWTSMCFGMLFTNTSQMVRVFQDGMLCSERLYEDGNFDYLHYWPGNPLRHYIYQERNDWSPHGFMTRIYFWSRLLSKNEMRLHTGQCNTSVDSNGLFFDWESLNTFEDTCHQLTIEEMSKDYICQTNHAVPVKIGLYKKYHEAKSLCSHLGGVMSMEFDENIQYTIGDLNCTSVDARKFWIPVVQGKSVNDHSHQYQWVDDRPGTNMLQVQDIHWMQGQPNGQLLQQCVELHEVHQKFMTNDESCSEERCSICIMPLVQIYTMRGSRQFDGQYTLSLNMQEDKSKIVFEGTGSTKVTWFLANGTTHVADSLNNDSNIRFGQWPFGLLRSSNTWKTKENGKRRYRWKFTNCKPRTQFTCWSGDCIPLDQRCNERADCEDRSDEHKCQQIFFDKNEYRKTYIPRNWLKNTPLKIETGFDVIDIVEINEAKMFFSIKFNVWLKWRDDRLQYQNLNQNSFWNAIPSDLSKKLWTPTLIFENNNEREVLTFNKISSVMMLVRNGRAAEASLDQIDEARVYMPNETDIVLKTLLFQNFKCNFDLEYIPFDHQTCSVRLDIPQTSRGKMELVVGRLNMNVRELNRSLNRFMVTSISLQGNSNSTNLVINLKRLNISYWLSLFIPSMCLILAAEITLFIDKKHFKATITVALTANLVMYTLYKNIQEKLPEDSRLKLIDYWLLHGLLMPMVVFMMLVSNELLDSNPEENSALKNPDVTKRPGSVVDKMEANKMNCLGIDPKTSMLICKALVPATSIVFIIVFFFVICLNE